MPRSYGFLAADVTALQLEARTAGTSASERGDVVEAEVPDREVAAFDASLPSAPLYAVDRGEEVLQVYEVPILLAEDLRAQASLAPVGPLADAITALLADIDARR